MSGIQHIDSATPVVDNPAGGGTGVVSPDAAAVERFQSAFNEASPGSGDSTASGGEELKVLNLNAAGGHGNGFYDSDGMDPGDVDELAQRIAEGDADVATLQEVWRMDVPALEKKLEQITGDEWDLHFVEASGKARCDDDWMGTFYPSQPFGNAIAVRRGEGVAYSELIGQEKLDSAGDLGKGSDGRSALAVRVHTDDGGSVVVATAHIDTEDDIGNANERARQIGEVRRFTEGVAGGDPVIITGDFNHTLEGDGAPSEALRDYLDQGYTDAGDIGPTSDFGEGRRIDFIFADQALRTGKPERVQGDSPDKSGQDHDLSDHDGILVSVTVPEPDNALCPLPEGTPPAENFDVGGDYRPDDNYR